jgi:Domain of unknown function (DUF4276)
MAPKILGEPVEVDSLKGGSWPGIVGDIRDLLQILCVKHITTPFDCVLVVVDANGTGPVLRVQHLTQKVGNRQYRFGQPIYHAIVRHVETWLLGDSNAINAAAGKSVPVVRDPESLADAKRHLIQVLKNNRCKPYDRAFQRVAAERADVGAISQSCPGFRTFVQKLQQCHQQETLFPEEPTAEN